MPPKTDDPFTGLLPRRMHILLMQQMWDKDPVPDGTPHKSNNIAALLCPPSLHNQTPNKEVRICFNNQGHLSSLLL